MSQKSKYTKEEIIDAVIDMKLNKSASTRFILDFLMNELKYSQSQAYEYLKWARESIAETYNDKNVGAVEEAIGELESVMQYARTNKNYKLWFEIRKELNKVRGVYAADRIEVTGKIEHAITAIEVNIIDSNVIDITPESKKLDKLNE